MPQRKHQPKYQVIYADPPWPEKASHINTKTAHAHRSFRTMTEDELASLSVQRLAAEDCVLLLWSTFRHLPMAFRVMESWGFKPVREAFVWVKVGKRGQPMYSLAWDTAACAEVCLLGSRGRRLIPITRMVPSIVLEPRTRLAEKPHEVVRRIESMYSGPKVELFARRRMSGWDCWGDEVESTPSVSAVLNERSRVAPASLVGRDC